MTISPWFIYLIGIIQDLKYFFVILAVLGLFTSALFAMMEYGRKAVKVLAFSVAFLLFAVFTPSRGTLVAMVVIPPIVNNEAVQSLPGEILDFVREWLHEERSALSRKSA